MKRSIIFGLMVAAVLLIAAPVTRVLAVETCEAFEQPFSTLSFPMDGDDWVITHGINGRTEDITAAGFTAKSIIPGDVYQNTNFTLELPPHTTITHAEFDIQELSHEAPTIAIVRLCYDESCSTYSDAINFFDEALDITHVESTPDTEWDEVVAIFIEVAGPDQGDRIDNILVEGILDACPYRPVLTVDTLAEVTTDDVHWTIGTTPGAKVFAVDDATVGGVWLDSTGYSVGLFVNGVDFVLYSRLSVAFAEIGDTIEGGCVLGYAGPAEPSDPNNYGLIKYQHNTNLGDWRDYNESLSVTPCNVDDSNCINLNPEFNDDNESWLSRDGLMSSLNTGGDSILLLPPDVQAYQPGFEVALADTYYVTIAARLTGLATTGQVTAWIGGTESSMAVNIIGNEYAVVTSQPLSPAFNGTSEFRLTNTSVNNAGLQITFACLHTGDATVQPPACYFADSQLQTDSFETEGGATFEPSVLGVGRYSIPVGGAIRSPVDISAFSDAPTDFTLVIQGAAPDAATEVTASIIDSDTDDPLQAIDTYEFTSLLWANPSHGFTLDAAEHVVGDLYIENTGAETVLISALCLSSDAGVWAGYENPDYANEPLLPTDCTPCQFPESLIDVVAWLNWIGCVLRYLIFCLLMTLVNNIWNTVLAIMAGVGLFGRWLGRAISIVVDWAWRAAGRLLATLISSAIPILNAIMAWILSLPFVRDLLDAASVAGLWINGIIAFIVGVINLFVAAVRFVGVLITLVGTAWVAFIQGLSGSSEFTAILPDCYDSGSPFYDVCLVLDVLNFVVSQVTAVAVLFGAVAISIVWRTAAGIKDDIERVFES